MSETASSSLVPYKDKIIPVKLQDTAVFYLENDLVHLISFNEKEYFPGKNLEELEKIGGKDFYRADRQFLMNRNAVRDVSNQLGKKLWVNVSVP
ncbi:LytTR family transcriptional regulator DNA-binding domain-containing protein [Chryseolinea lacunae]|uniref:LytTR family transcriptional regulator DNA-binding domain-containing protein n=1 Tax=Chryseolinea lacunae TaxID=2801331 RepID=A0ABS1KTC8_9BACT|nr:LytTR family transcriptional regulator DNA-binding domain-containing protein [Chryseolinea lacunae]MBL0742624.1 LytTR family transcriptional regulator DNA-binding domain-containing protein [Chryseolinea lacunae]